MFMFLFIYLLIKLIHLFIFIYFNSVGFREMQFVRAFEFAIEEINNSSDLLSDVSLGYHIYDSCASVPMAVKVAFQLANGLDLIFNGTDSCAKSAAVTAVVAESGSTPSISISRLLGPFGIPQVHFFFFSLFIYLVI